jgi:hypothetical protein
MLPSKIASILKNRLLIGALRPISRLPSTMMSLLRRRESSIASVVSSITGVNTAVFEIINTTTVFGIHCKFSKPVRLQYCTI